MDATAEGAYGRAMILNNLGLLYKQMGQWEEAVESFQRAMASEPSIEAASNLAAILLDAGSYEQVSCFEQALRLEAPRRWCLKRGGMARMTGPSRSPGRAFACVPWQGGLGQGYGGEG
jgi:tetratricopeptide (TPR) repeat protein